MTIRELSSDASGESYNIAPCCMALFLICLQLKIVLFDLYFSAVSAKCKSNLYVILKIMFK